MVFTRRKSKPVCNIGRRDGAKTDGAGWRMPSARRPPLEVERGKPIEDGIR
jgi:hypothetical protein